MAKRVKHKINEVAPKLIPHAFQDYVVIVEEILASKRGPHLLCMRIVCVTGCMIPQFVVEALIRWQAGLILALPGVHVLIWVDMLAKRRI